ncbi:heat shock protein 9/12-domain-containing protein [Cristinia sonorae]|uniref:Heat shock protein 9/12-domain-containing protein n=1 Tax=Cristinia sonorae TaxID=1940300 RepID=A0A8K0UZ41_9AGAR|nr:heat shock protein 9/12-domain-containing protein [Cristinia sonorae]
MSDNARQSFTDKATAAMKPDSEKSTTEHMGDKFKGKGDSFASSAQPESQKSTTQKMGDTFSSNSNHNNESMMDKAKNAVGLGDKH